MKLLSAAGNGNGTAQSLVGNGSYMHTGTVGVTGTFGGATVTLEVAFDGVPTQWFPLTDASWTEAGTKNITVKATHIRAVVSGGSSPSITAELSLG